ncbi:MAG TPA: hypothetical protein VFH38_06545 [Jatrophihabitans sp.]|nr:hypothetical protein [Jatrophihabitans sp.]
MQRSVAAVVVAAAASAVLVGSVLTQAAAQPAAGSAGVQGEHGGQGSQTRVVYRTLHVTPKADSFVSSQWRKARFGDLRHVAVGTRAHNTRDAYLRFQIPQGGSVVSARLTITRLGHWHPQPIDARFTTPRRWSERYLSDVRAPRVRNWIDTERAYRDSRQITFDVTRAFRHRRVATIAITAPVVRGIVQFASRQAGAGRPVLRVVIAKRQRIPTGPHPSSSSAPPPDVSSSASSATTSPPASEPAPSSSSVAASSSSVAPSSSSVAPSSSSVAPSSSSSSAPNCTISPILVPSCGRWWGITPLAYQYDQPLIDKVAVEEDIAQRPFDIVHQYNTNGQLFPTAAEQAAALQPGHNRLLLIDWKPATDMSWAAVAAGKADSRIDAEAAYLKANWRYPFFLSIYHEPEDNVDPTPGSGYTASDFADMFRHTILRLRADGVTNAITVMNYMGFVNWTQKPWFNQLWPGNDVVDWIGLDPYGTGSPTGWGAHDLTTLIDRKLNSFPGYYTWATRNFPGKPIMLCEWGISYDPSYPTGQADFFNTMDDQIGQYPALRALVYFDIPNPPPDHRQTTVTLNPIAEAAYQRVGKSAPFVVPGGWSY